MTDLSSTATVYSPGVTFFPILVWLVLVGFFLAICLAVQDGIARLKRLHQIPCSRCAYFTGNYYLKCPVHPCKALSEEAINCLDYEPVRAQTIRLFPKKTNKKCMYSSRNS